MKKLFLFFVFLFISIQLQAVTLRIIGVGDLYELNPNKDNRGGYGKLAALIKDSEKNFDHVLFLHAGDAFSPSVEASVTKGAQAVEILNMMGVDYFTPGNHEFDFGVDRYNELREMSEFTYLISNLINGEGRIDKGTSEYEIRDIGGFKVGFYGLITPRSAALSSMGSYRFKDMMTTAEKMYKLLKYKGAEIVIALSHSNVEEDMALYQSGFADIIVSGDDHYNVTFTDGKSYWFESGEDAEKVAALDLNLERDSKGRVSFDGTFSIHDTANIEADPEVQAKVDEIAGNVNSKLGEKIGTVKTPLDTRRATVRAMESNFGNLVADAVKADTQSDIGFVNGGGIRGNRMYDEGHSLTRKDILTELPFGNVTVKIELTGEKVLEALENGVSEVENGAGRFPQVSGISFTFDSSKSAGSRVSNVTVDGKPLDMKKIYTVATNDYMMSGGDGYKAFTSGKVLIDPSSAKLMATVVMEYVTSMNDVSVKTENRIVSR